MDLGNALGHGTVLLSRVSQGSGCGDWISSVFYQLLAAIVCALDGFA